MPKTQNSGGCAPCVVASIAGSDSFAGAGIQADLKTAQSLGAYCATIVTAVTAQNSKGVFDAQFMPHDAVTAQLNAVFADLEKNLSAIKIGMLGNAQTVETVARFVHDRAQNIPVVLDTVMRATSGGKLLDIDGKNALIEHMLPRARIITPNLIEAAKLLDAPMAQSIDEMKEQALALKAAGANAVLLKGGHLEGDSACDILAAADKCIALHGERIRTEHTHGTGCTLSTAIAVYLAKGHALEPACRQAKLYVSHALQSAKHWQLTDTNGPLDHGMPYDGGGHASA